MIPSFHHLILQRQSVRKYDPGPVEKEKVAACLEAARLSPSASNSQPWTFILVDNPEMKEKVAAETYDPVVTFNKFAHQAPVILVIVIEKPRLITRIGRIIKNKDWPLIDIGITAAHFCLQAAELGLGTCMLGWYNEKRLKKLLNIPAGKTIGLVITLGYAVNGYPLREKVRKTGDEVYRYNSY